VATDIGIDDFLSGQNDFLLFLYFCIIICWDLQLKLWLMYILSATKVQVGCDKHDGSVAATPYYFTLFLAK
jgi:hypothetical protein